MKPDARTAREYAETVLAQLGECRNCFMPCGQCPEAARALVRGLLHEVERLEQERDEARQKLDKLIHAVKHDTIPNSTIYQRQAEAAEARAQRYREALTTCAEEGSVGARRALSADPLVCRDPDLCWGKGTCPRDPACNE